MNNNYPTPKEFDDNIRATRIKEIVKDIEDLTDSLNTSEELNEAWSKITNALGYLSAKDSMFKYKKEKEEKND